MKQIKQKYLILIILATIFSFNAMGQQSNHDGHELTQKASNSLIDSIDKNDTLHIFYSIAGCEYYFTEEIIIYRNSDSLFSKLTTNIPYKKILLNPLIKSLNDSSIFAYAEFEKSGRNLKTHYGCTTREEFIIKLKNEIIQFEDNGCEYDGYNMLKNIIFGKADIEKYNKEIYR